MIDAARLRRTGSSYTRPQRRTQAQALSRRASEAGLTKSELIRRAVDRLLSFEHPSGIAADAALARATAYVPVRGDRTHLIYALVDPRDGLPRYVGQSLADQRRPIPSPGSTSDRLGLWLRELRSSQLRPLSLVLERVSASGDPNERHEAWVRGGFSVGWPLLQAAPQHPMWNHRQDRGRGERR